MYNIVLIDNSFAGPQDLLQYYFKGINHCAEDGAGRKGLFLDITLGRPKTSNMITIFRTVVDAFKVILKEVLRPCQ